MSASPGRPIGIDLGTTFSAVAYVNPQGEPRNILNPVGSVVTPSAVWIRADRSIVVGQEALEARRNEPARVAVNFKRDMGERLYRETVGGKEFSPEALSAQVLKRLADDAEAEVGEVSGAVITVPAYFGDNSRKATQDAGRMAGLNVLDIVNEPTAAALANAFRTYLARGGNRARLDIARIAARAPTTTLVYDLGGGTFDVTIIRIDHNNFEVIATGGEVRLGGIDFDKRIVDYFCEEFVRRHGVDPRDLPESTERIRSTCELAKIALSENEQTAIVGEHLGRRLQLPFGRKRFENLTADLLARTRISIEMLLEDAMLGWDRIDEILLVGGSSRMPAVSRILESMSGKAPNMAIAPEQIVSHGAALHAAMLELRSPTATITVDGGRRLDSDAAPSGDTQTDMQRMQAIFDEPVERVAREITVTDVNAHSLGVIVRSSRDRMVVNNVVIPRNTPIPATRVKVFGTEASNQRMVRLRIVEGESQDPQACLQIGECLIRQLPKGLPKGAPVEVRFEYDAGGRIHVRAAELSSRVSAEVEIRRDSETELVNLEDLTDTVSEIDEQ